MAGSHMTHQPPVTDPPATCHTTHQPLVSSKDDSVQHGLIEEAVPHPL